MIRRRDEAYVLRTQALGEADLIVTLFARQHGKVRGVARAARKSRRRFGGLLEPLTLVGVEWSEHEGRELQRIETLEPGRSYATMQSDPLLQAACAVISEIAETFAREAQADERPFQLLGAVLDALEAGCAPWVAVRYFEFWTLRLQGLLPDLERCATCGAPLPQSGPTSVAAPLGALCLRCARDRDGVRRIGTAERQFLAAVRTLAPADVQRGKARIGAGSGVDVLLRGTLEGFAEKRFRAYRHLVALAGDKERPA